MKGLTWWFRIVGTIYALLGIGFFPPLNEPRLPVMIPIDVSTETVAYKALVDWTFFFGLDMLVIGAFLLYASRNPLRHIYLVWLIIWLEVIRGILADIYYMARGYASIPIYAGFIIFHLIIIGTGVAALRRAQTEQDGI